MNTSIMCLLLDPWRKRQRASALEDVHKNITDILDVDEGAIAKWIEDDYILISSPNLSYQLYS